MIKRSVSIRGHRTAVSLEEPFWEALREIADRRGVSVAAVVREIDDARTRRMASEMRQHQAGAAGTGGLSSAIRVAVLEAARAGALPMRPGTSGLDKRLDPQAPVNLE